MTLTHGLAPWQVLQRGSRGTARVAFGGACTGSGDVYVRLAKGAGGQRAGAWMPAGLARGGCWKSRIEAIPTGGPHTVEVCIGPPGRRSAERLMVRHVLVGDLWVMAGQSNMEGQGRLDAPLPRHPSVHLFAPDGTWRAATEPTHHWLEATDAAHWYGMTRRDRDAMLAAPQSAREFGASAGLAFGRAMVHATGVPVGLVPTALGGSSIGQWDPADTVPETSLFLAMVDAVRRAGSTRIAGLLWYQGEADAFDASLVAAYPEALSTFIAATRAAFRHATLPVVMVQIARVAGMGVTPGCWNGIQAAQLDFAAGARHVGCVSAIDLPLDDPIHISGAGQNILGRRLAISACRLRFGQAHEDGPRIARVHLRQTSEAAGVDVVFAGVNTRLHPARHISGFSIRDASGTDLGLIWEARVHPQHPDRVVLHVTDVPPPTAALWYGWGTNPYCNLLDEAGLAALASGPWTLT